MSTLHRFDSADDAAASLAGATAGVLRDDLERLGRASLVVSGGRTPIPLFQALARQPMAWEHVTITLADERWVPPDHPDSNERLVREHLLVGPAAEATLVGLYTGPEPDAAAVIERLTPLHRPWSAVLLGMGGDGHFASIFPELPERDALLSDAAPMAAVTRPDHAPHTRITLSLPALSNTRLMALLITGTDKLSVYDGASQAGLPVAQLLERTAVQTYWGP